MWPWIGHRPCHHFRLLNRVRWRRIVRLIQFFHNQDLHQLVLLKCSRRVNAGKHHQTCDLWLLLWLLGITSQLLLPRRIELRANVPSRSLPRGERRKQEPVFAEHHSTPLTRPGNKSKREIKPVNVKLRILLSLTSIPPCLAELNLELSAPCQSLTLALDLLMVHLFAALGSFHNLQIARLLRTSVR